MTSLRRVFGWKRMGAFLAFAVALSAWSWSGVLFTIEPVPLADLAEYFGSITKRTLVMYFPIYVAVALADTLPLRGRRRIGVLIAALVLGAALAVQLRCALMPSQMLYVYGSVKQPYCDAFPTWRSYWNFPGAWLTPLTIAGLVMVFVFARRRDQQLTAALGAAGSAQIESRRQRIESEIEAMRSRVDPDVLLESLRDIRARYDRDWADGDAGLDDLIRTLRQAAGSAPQPAGGG